MTLPLKRNGSPVSSAWMMCAPYSSLGPPGELRRSRPRELFLAAAQVLVERHIEVLDELGPGALDEPRDVLGQVFRRLGAEVAEVPQHLVADSVPVRDVAFRAELRIDVAAAVRELEVEGEVVDPGAAVLEPVDAQVGREVARRALDRVAQADGADRAGTCRGPAEHRHRVDVLQQHGIRADLLHLAAEVEQDGNRPEAAHDPADPQRVADRLPQAEALRHLEVDDRRGAVAADLEHREHVVGARERRASVERRFDRDAGGLGHPLGRAEPVGVDVHQRDGQAVGQVREAHHVADQRAREDRRAGADQRHLHYVAIV